MADNGNCKETVSSCSSWLVYWSEALAAAPGHFTAITAATVTVAPLSHLFIYFLHFLPFDIYIYLYIYIFFTPRGYHYSNCFRMNTGVISIVYKCVFHSMLGPELGLLSRPHIMSPF